MFGRKSSQLRKLENQLGNVIKEVEQNISNNSSMSDDITDLETDISNAYASASIVNDKLRLIKHDGNHDEIDYVDPVIASVYQTANQVDTIVTNKGYQTASQVNTTINGKGYQTSSQVDTIVTKKGYQTASQVNTTINGKGYQTASQVDTIVTGKGYQTSSQVDSNITGRGYQTSSQVDSIVTSKGYQTSSNVTAYVTSLNLQSASGTFTPDNVQLPNAGSLYWSMPNASNPTVYGHSRTVYGHTFNCVRHSHPMWLNQGLHIDGIHIIYDFADSFCDQLTNQANGTYVTADPPSLGFGLTVDYSIVCDTVVVFSDERIKENIRDIDDGVALEQLRLIQPKIYGYKDKYKKGNIETIGYIAQQIKEVIPQAVATDRRAIPNILKPARVHVTDDKIEIELTVPSENDITPGAFIKVITERDKEQDNYEFEVVSSSTTLIVVSAGTQSIEKLQDGMKAVVYGEIVDDFHCLDENQIFTIATASVQELDRQVQAEKAKTAQLQTQMAGVMARLDALEN